MAIRVFYEDAAGGPVKEFGPHTLLCACVATCNVHDLVTDHIRELVLVVHQRDETPRDEDVPAGQGERVRHLGRSDGLRADHIVVLQMRVRGNRTCREME
mgnify:CR=1 FL=1